jgi:uncharacterized protein (DUF1786 family)
MQSFNLSEGGTEMGLDDFADSKVAIAVAATAAVTSPRVRGVLRRGAVYGVAGTIMAGDAVSAAARGVRHGARQAADSAGGVVQDGAEQARPEGSGPAEAGATETGATETES